MGLVSVLLGIRELPTCALASRPIPRRWLLLPNQEVSVVACALLSENYPSSSLTLSPGARLFLCTSGGVSQCSACFKWQRSMMDAKKNISSVMSSSLVFTFLKPQAGQVLNLAPMLCLRRPWLMEFPSPLSWRWVCVPGRNGIQTYVLFVLHGPTYVFDVVIHRVLSYC